MTLNELKAFIYKTREEEGVNWYLRDTTPAFGVSGGMYSLITYDEDEAVTNTVKLIEERNGRKIPLDVLVKIAAAREHAGMNLLFAKRKTFKGKKSPVDIYNEARINWLETERYLFVTNNQ